MNCDCDCNTCARKQICFFLHIYRPQRSCGQGYVFTRVCHSVNGGGGCLLWGVSAPGVSALGVSALGGVCSWGDVCSREVCSGVSTLLRGHLLCSGGVCSGGKSALGGCLLPGVSARGGGWCLLPGGGGVSQHALRQTPPSLPGKQSSAYDQRVAGTHPIGMHSCGDSNRSGKSQV